MVDEDIDTELFSNNPDVMAGDHVIIFNTQEDSLAALPPGEKIKEGDLIVIHPEISDDLVTHGNTRIKVGDKVIVVQSQDNDLIALKPSWKPYRDCPLIQHGTHDESLQHDPPEEEWGYQYHAYTIHLSKTITPWDIDANALKVRFDFRPKICAQGMQPWWEGGGIWLGISEDGKDWYWPGGDPYRTIRGPPMFCSSPQICEAGNHNEDYTIWTFEDFVHTLYPWGRATFDINYVHIHISHNSSLYWKNCSKTVLLHSTFCQGVVRDEWDGEIMDTTTSDDE